ncbi:hypothetical protein [Bacillus pumilus]|uniref:hypothetical protein n=1 Tax=Bacillus pumilus TaxID=1408 RepID=UPI0033059733
MRNEIDKLKFEIREIEGALRSTKNYTVKNISLWIKDQHVCDIKDQKEVCEKLLEFFINIRKRVELIHKHNDELEFGLGVFKSSSYVCFSVLRERQRELENIMSNIKKYDYLGEKNMTLNDLDLAVTVTLNDDCIIEYSQNEEIQWFWTHTDPKGNKEEGEAFPTIEDCYLDVRDRFSNR